jgi:hypothetical protein
MLTVAGQSCSLIAGPLIVTCYRGVLNPSSIILLVPARRSIEKFSRIEREMK